MIRYLPFVIFFFLFILESLFVELLPTRFLSGNLVLVPHFLITAIILLTIYGDKRQGIWYGLIFGLMFDIVYTEVIGIYLFMFPLTAYLVSKLMKILQSNMFMVTIVILLGISILEMVVYEINFLIHITGLDFQTFLSHRLVPTLILNFLFSLIVIYPLKKQFEKLNEHLLNRHIS